MTQRLATPAEVERIEELLASFKLPTLAQQTVQRLEQAGHELALVTLLELLEAERDERFRRRCQRLLKGSGLPPGKTFDTLDPTRVPKGVLRKLQELASGEFLDRTDNVLCFGLPGSLLAAKRDLELPRALRKLDAFELIILDDIGYVQQSADEVEVLFTLMAERYERRSLLITSNLVFGEWDRIFKNPMTTAAAIDRVVHHSVILEFNGQSVRAEEAKKRSPAPHKP